MNWDNNPSEWRNNRRRGFIDDRFFEEIDKIMEEMLRETFREIPEDAVREKKLPDGRIVREFGPCVYGYSMTLGQDGKPIIREFGNVRPSLKSGPSERSKLEVKDEREPLIDVIVNNDVRVVAELPGVEKKDISLEATENTLTVSVDTEQHKYYKEVEIPTEVNPDSARATYKNGVLEVVLTRLKKREKGKGIMIE
jgi:HSP20 family protein